MALRGPGHRGPPHGPGCRAGRRGVRRAGAVDRPGDGRVAGDTDRFAARAGRGALAGAGREPGRQGPGRADALGAPARRSRDECRRGRTHPSGRAAPSGVGGTVTDVHPGRPRLDPAAGPVAGAGGRGVPDPGRGLHAVEPARPRAGSGSPRRPRAEDPRPAHRRWAHPDGAHPRWARTHRPRAGGPATRGRGDDQRGPPPARAGTGRTPRRWPQPDGRRAEAPAVRRRHPARGARFVQ